VPFEGVYDIFALRIILDCPPEEEKTQCWAVYSIVTDYYIPNTERLRDWISIPKSNGYESLHTTVSAGGGRWVEIQIRTERMDAVAERGIAAHWRYKGVNQGALTSEMWLGRLRELMENTPHALAQRFDSRPSSGEIFVFTPNGDLRKLPEGATVLDFAFDIHSNLGCSCSGGKINGRAVPIKETLHNGDIVEILTQKNQTPKADWLSAVKTAKARSKIKAFIREEQAKSARLGREELERKLKNWKFGLTIDEAVGYLCKYYKLKAGTELYGLIATEKIDLSTVKEILTRWQSGEADEERRAAAAAAEQAKLQNAAARPAHSTYALVIDAEHQPDRVQARQVLQPDQGRRYFRLRDDQLGHYDPPHRLSQCTAYARELSLPRHRRPLAADGRRGVPRDDPHRGGRYDGHGQPYHRNGDPRPETQHPFDEPRFAGRSAHGYGRRGGARHERRRHARPRHPAHQGRAEGFPDERIAGEESFVTTRTNGATSRSRTVRFWRAPAFMAARES